MSGAGADRIGALWRDYRTKVIPVTAPAIQARECRRAFYAGANALFTSILAMLDPGAEATEADLTKMDLIAEEFRAFARAIEDGRA